MPLSSLASWTRRSALALALTGGASLAHAAGGAVAVDVELALAVDVSRSMDDDEQRLQREGYVEAFRAKTFHDAVKAGAHGRIAVAYMEWAGADDQKIVIPFTVIDGPQAALDFAARLEAAPIGRMSRTSISRAIAAATAMFVENGFSGVRRVIDISGDGPNNAGRAGGDGGARGGLAAGLRHQRPAADAQAAKLGAMGRDRRSRHLLRGLRDRGTGRLLDPDQGAGRIRRGDAQEADDGDRHAGAVRRRCRKRAGAARRLPDRRNDVATDVGQLSMAEPSPRLRLALVAHDAKKSAMTDWAARHEDFLARCDLVATGTTGARIAERCRRLAPTCGKSGPLGGDQQIGARLAEGLIDALIFFVDPLSPHPHDVDVKALMRVALVYDTPLALSASAADLIIEALERRPVPSP